MYPSLTLIPMIYAGANYKPIKWLQVGANVSYGGYSKLRFGLYSSFNYKLFLLRLLHCGKDVKIINRV
jgi:hypothetical protein